MDLSLSKAIGGATVMDTAAIQWNEPIVLPDSLGHDLDIESVIHRAIAGTQPITQRLERRRDTRYAYPFPLTLTPLEEVLRGDLRSAIRAIGKHLTAHGVDFYTTAPIAAKEVVCQFHSPSCSHAVVVELHWCRHNAQGWFENGGKFLRVWKSPASLRALAG